jgi:hypothetical protein
MRWASAPLLALAVAAAAIVPAAPASAAIPPHPRWESSVRFGTWHTGAFFIDNDSWNGAAGPQTVWANSRDDWGAESTQPAGNKAVMTYPNIARDFSNVPVSTFTTLRNGYRESMPAGRGLGAEAADDIWLNKFKLEIMIWVDNHGQRPAGNDVGHATIMGQHFSVWDGAHIWTLVLDHRQTAGRTYILAALKWLMRHHDIPASATLTQVGFGWEVTSTGGTPMDFTMSGYGLTS